jgi:ribosomal protein L14E/L6E/L27E
MNEDYQIGQIVFSKCGRDKGKAFIVVSVEEDYVHLVDGKTRTLENPKKKKHKHTQRTKTIVEWIKQNLIEDTLMDHQIRKAIDEYLKASVREGGL